MMETVVTEIMVAVELEAIFKANCAAGTCGAVDYTLSIFPKTVHQTSVCAVQCIQYKYAIEQ